MADISLTGSIVIFIALALLGLLALCLALDSAAAAQRHYQHRAAARNLAKARQDKNHA